MSTLTTDYLDLIGRLPSGATLRLPNVGWDEYEHLLSEMESHPAHRLTYDRGRLVIMSPKREHETYKVLIGRLVYAISEELGVEVEATGSTTLKRKKMARGVEPDESFYVQNVARVVGQHTAISATEPPPDVVVEIDTTNELLDKFDIYAALGVPEIWRYDGEKAHFYQLSETSYQEIQSSIAFPLLTAEDLTRFVEQSKTEGQTATVAAFIKFLRERSSS